MSEVVRADRRPVRRSPTSASSIRSQRGRVLQAKLSVGPAGDRYEQEADRVAAAVMRDIEAGSDVASDRLGSGEDRAIRRQSRILAATRRPEPADARPIVSRIQRRTPNVGAQGGTADADTEAAIGRARGRGRPLDDGIRRSMERSFGADFSGVRVHADGAANDLNGRIQARAATVGNDIFFSRGQYDPSSASGQELLAHELTHVVQQGAARQGGIAQRTQAVVQRLFLTEAGRDIAEDQTTLKDEYKLARAQGRQVDLAAIMHLQTSTAVRPEAIMTATFPVELLEQLNMKEMGPLFAANDTDNDKGEADGKAEVAVDPVVAELADDHIASALYAGGAGADLARRFKASFDKDANPAIPVPLMKDLRTAGWLKILAVKYRDSPYGPNGMIYTFRIKGINKQMGEWHVHWEAGKKAGNPGWKSGKKGEKTATGEEMRPILGDLWAVTKSTGGAWK